MNNKRRSKRWALWHRRRLYNQANALARRGLNFLFYMRERDRNWVSRRLNHKLQFVRRYFAPTAVLKRTYRETAYWRGNPSPGTCYAMIDGVITKVR